MNRHEHVLEKPGTIIIVVIGYQHIFRVQRPDSNVPQRMAVIIEADLGKPVIEYIRVLIPEILKDAFHFGVIAIVQHQQLEVLQRLRKKGVNQHQVCFYTFYMKRKLPLFPSCLTRCFTPDHRKFHHHSCSLVQVAA